MIQEYGVNIIETIKIYINTKNLVNNPRANACFNNTSFRLVSIITCVKTVGFTIWN